MKKIIAVLAAVLLMLTLMVPFSALADDPKVVTSLTGPSAVKQGDTIEIAFHADGTEALFTYGEANITYNSADLQFVSFTKATITNWVIGFDNNGTRVHVAANNDRWSDPINDKKLIGTVKFKVLANPGATVRVATADLNFSSRGGASIPAVTSAWSATLGGSAPAASSKAAPSAATPSAASAAASSSAATSSAATSSATTSSGAASSTAPTDASPPGSTNAPLKELDFGDYGLWPEFDPNDPDKTDYVLNLPDGTTKLDINALPTEDGAAVEIKGGDDLEKGLNIVQIVVTAEDGSQTVYTIAAIVGGEAEKISDVIANWWWMLIVILVVGLATGFLIDKFILKPAKKKEGTEEGKE